MKPARNDPCPCGSGKKYKRCCLAKDEAAHAAQLAAAQTAGPPQEAESVTADGKRGTGARTKPRARRPQRGQGAGGKSLFRRRVSTG